jgi:hypothetical protein
MTIHLQSNAVSRFWLALAIDGHAKWTATMLRVPVF